MQVTLHNNTFTFNADKTCFWHNANALIISDVHLGKASHLQKNGLALPRYYAISDILLLDSIFSRTTADTIFFLGDLFHSELNNEWIMLTDLLNKHNRKHFNLLIGNHDILDTKIYTNAGINVLSTYNFNNVLLTHEPNNGESELNICGHIHPGFLLQKKGFGALKLPCFYFKPLQLIMPAFGNTTGLFPLVKNKLSKIWIILNDKILEV